MLRTKDSSLKKICVFTNPIALNHRESYLKTCFEFLSTQYGMSFLSHIFDNAMRKYRHIFRMHGSYHAIISLAIP